MIRMVSVAVAVLLLGAGVGRGAAVSFTYQNYDNTPEDYVTDHTGANLVGGASGNSSPFIQLIWVGLDGLIDAATNEGDGTVGGDDQVFDFYFMESSFLYGDGQFTVNVSLDDADAGKNFYIRIWEDVASDYALGEVPTAVGSYYGNSALYAFSGGPVSETWDAGSWQTDLQSVAVPEPSTLMLFACGMAVAGVARRRRRQKA